MFPFASCAGLRILPGFPPLKNIVFLCQNLSGILESASSKWVIILKILVPMVPHTKINYWLVVSTYPSEKWWSSSVGMMKFPTEWKVIIHSCSSHHQPDKKKVVDVHPLLKFQVKIIPVGHLHFWATARPRGNCCQNDNDTRCFAGNLLFPRNKYHFWTRSFATLLNFAVNWFWVKNRVKKNSLFWASRKMSWPVYWCQPPIYLFGWFRGVCLKFWISKLHQNPII